MDRPTTRPNLVGPTPGSAHLVQGVTAPQAAHSAVTAGRLLETRPKCAKVRWATMEYVEKVRSQFLSLRQHF